MTTIPGQSDPPLIRTEGLSKVYRTGAVAFTALTDVNITIAAGDYIALTGPSGSGKSTLMHLLGCLDTPSQGRVIFQGRDTGTLDDTALAALRNRSIGFVFQNFNLLPRLSAQANVELPMIYAGVSRSERARRAAELLAMVGLENRRNNRPGELSGGEMQRVAIARALANRPALILADEPTGNLDSRTGAGVMKLFDELAAAGNTIVLVTHDAAVAGHAGRQIRICDGRICS